MQLKAVFPFTFFVLVLTACSDNSHTKKEKLSDTLTGNQQIKELETKLSKDPQADSVRESLVQQFALSNQYNKALEQVEILLKKNPSSPAYLYMKADALEKKGDTTGAISFFEQAIAAAGIFSEAQLRLSALYAEKGNKKALQLCDSLLKDPTAVSLRSDLLFIKAVYYTKAKDTKNAIRLYDQLIREDYTYLDAYIEKGLIYYDMGNFTEAHKQFERSTGISNKFADGYFWMAKAEEKMNKTQDAINNYKRSLALDQSITEARDALKRLGVVK